MKLSESRRLAEVLFDDAVKRLYTSRRSVDPEEIFKALIGVVSAACILDRVYERSVGADYLQFREGATGGPAVPGFRQVRNALEHASDNLQDLVSPAAARFGIVFPIVFPLAFEFRGVVWRRLEELPGVRRNPRTEAAYVEGLQGRPVLATVRALRRFFAASRCRFQ